jgi:phosphoribosylformimino-5-aminoimidazole carboxamide ribotide isomerase
MKIIPALDLKNGTCVRLFQGDYSQETVYSDNPIVMAKNWEAQGAEALHVVDLDGAREGKMANTDIIQKIVKAISIPVQIGGGIRTLNSIKELIKIGVSKIILGTMVLEDEKMLSKAIDLFGKKIIVSLDAKNGILMKNGWLEKSERELFPTLQELETKGVASVIYTDTIKDGTLTEPNYQMIKAIVQNTKIKLTVAGGVSSSNQLMKLKQLNVDGVIIGKALYEGKINLKEVIALC